MIIMLIRSASFFPLFRQSKLPVYFCSQVQALQALLNSKYHLLGPPSFFMARHIQNILSPFLPTIQSSQKELNQLREQVIKENSKQNSQEDQSNKKLLQDYKLTYEKLVGQIQRCPLNNQWVYKNVGWYNIQSLYRNLLQKLLISKDQKEVISLSEALKFMDYKWNNDYGKINKQFFESQLIVNFFKNLMNMNIDPPVLRNIEHVLVTPLSIIKKRFYAHYFNRQIIYFLKYLKITDSYTLNDLIWLMNTYVKCMNDIPEGIISIERHLVTERPQLTNQDLTLLMEAYELKGGIDKNVYQLFIKPYILKNNMAKMSDLVAMIKFTICSESNDNNLLRQLYETISIKYENGEKLTNSKEFYNLHLYSHYLMIKGYRIKLPNKLAETLNSFCKGKAQGRDNLNYFSKKHLKKNVYYSPCLETRGIKIKQYQPTKMSDFEEKYKYKLRSMKLQDYKVHYKPMFCCFELDYALEHKRSGQIVDVEIQGIQYIFSSGKLLRQRQIRNQMLQYYNLKIMDVNYNNFKLKVFDEDEKLMNTKFS